MRLNIPYYAQTAEFTCGPACLLMVFKYFNPLLKLNRSLEFEIWRQCNMIGVRGSDPYGMSVPLLEAGHEVRLSTERRRMIASPVWRKRLQEHGFAPEDADLALFGVAENRKRALNRGLSVKCGRVSVETVVASFEEGWIPVALVHMGVVHQLDIPHWVVVADVGKDQVVFNDPYPPKGGKGIRVSRKEFQQMLAQVGTRIGLAPSVLSVRNKSL